MTDKPINVRIPNDLRDQIDQARGDIPRERWIRRALEATLSMTAPTTGTGVDRSPGAIGPTRDSASLRAHDQSHLAARQRVHPESCRCGVCTLTKGKR